MNYSPKCDICELYNQPEKGLDSMTPRRFQLQRTADCFDKRPSQCVAEWVLAPSPPKYLTSSRRMRCQSPLPGLSRPCLIAVLTHLSNLWWNISEKLCRPNANRLKISQHQPTQTKLPTPSNQICQLLLTVQDGENIKNMYQARPWKWLCFDAQRHFGTWKCDVLIRNALHQLENLLQSCLSHPAPRHARHLGLRLGRWRLRGLVAERLAIPHPLHVTSSKCFAED